MYMYIFGYRRSSKTPCRADKLNVRCSYMYVPETLPENWRLDISIRFNDCFSEVHIYQIG